MSAGVKITPAWARWVSRPAGWAVVAAVILVAIYVASMTSSGPWDPWETHYGEVARQIVLRHDPLDLWWKPGNGGPQGRVETYFASKPPLTFWVMAASMKLFGVGLSADPAEMVTSPWPEIAIRLPSLLAGLGTALFLGHVAWRLVSPRAGVLAAVILCTMPQFAIVTRQALTDMFFLGPVVLAAGAWALAWLQPDRELRTRGDGWRRIPWDRAYLAFFVLFVLAAVVPLAVLHQHAFDPLTWKNFGRFARRAQGLRDIQLEMFIYWGILAVAFVLSLRWRKRSQAWMGILYLAAGLSLIGKGLIGPGLIGGFVLGHLAISGRWELLKRCALPVGVLLFVVVSFPWHHAMMLYRGERWAGEYIVVNNLERFASGEQKQAVGTFVYYIATLGIAALPWSAVAPLGILAGLRGLASRGSKTAANRDTLMRFAVVWLVVSMLAISMSITKYYHYLLPVLPPLALMLGLWIDDVLARRERPAISPATAIACLAGVGVLYAVVRDIVNAPTWIAHLTTYLYTGMWTKGGPEVSRLFATCAPFAVGLLLWAAARRRWAVGAWLLSGVLTVAWVIDDYVPAASENWSQRSAMRVYFNERGDDDRIISWWFYYRGETFFTKADIWVMRDASKPQLADYIAEREGMGAALWFMTTEPHKNRLRSHLPGKYRSSIEVMYESFHYTLMRVHIP